MTEVWLAEEYHGYHYIFSTRPNADEWFNEEVVKNACDGESCHGEHEYFNDSTHRVLYCDSELIAKYEKYVLDEID